MDSKTFNVIVEARLEKTKKTLCLKAEEYARGDRLSNFKQIAALMDVTPEQALMGLVSKHIVALFDFTKDLRAGQEQVYARWDEKIGDVIAYMILLDAMRYNRP